jgi:hypothetical protein
MSKQIKDQLILLIKQNWQDLAGLTLLVFIVFANSLNGAFVSDDIPVILESKIIGTPAGIFASPHVFLRNFFYFVIFLTFGKNPLFFHLLNIIFHIGSACVLFLILKLIEMGRESERFMRNATDGISKVRRVGRRRRAASPIIRSKKSPLLFRKGNFKIDNH